MRQSANASCTHPSSIVQKKVKDVVTTAGKRRLVEVPYTATLAQTLNALVANRVTAVPVAAPPGHWIGAGGSMIVESDKITGAVRKHYIGMVTMLDILNHIADGVAAADCNFDARMAVPVSTVIGNCLEGLSLWTFSPNTSILDCMEVFSTGIHRALVPLDSQMENVVGVELEEHASSYRMLTQMDVLRFLKGIDMELKPIVSRSVGELGAVTKDIFAVTHDMKVSEAVQRMRAASLNAVPIVDNSSAVPDHPRLLPLVDGKGKKLLGTFSATDLRGCPITQMESWLHISIMDFVQKVSPSAAGVTSVFEASKLPKLVTCQSESSLLEVIDKVVSRHVHRVWVVDGVGLLRGVISVSDIIQVIRSSFVSQAQP